MRLNNKSFDDITAFRLPALSGKSFMAMGQDHDLLCHHALQETAISVTGVHNSAEGNHAASEYVPDASFFTLPWGSFPENNYDVILVNSIFHLLEDKSVFIQELLSRLNKDGLMIMSTSLAAGGSSKWVPVDLFDNNYRFPTHAKITSLLAPYAWKIMHSSINADQKKLRDVIIHIRKKRPYAYLLMEKPGSGKSTITRSLFENATFPVISGDQTYNLISKGKIQVPSVLNKAITQSFSTQKIMKTTDLVFNSGLGKYMVNTWITLAENKDFALDSYVPIIYHDLVIEELSAQGYFPVRLEWNFNNKQREASRKIFLSKIKSLIYSKTKKTITLALMKIKNRHEKKHNY